MKYSCTVLTGQTLEVQLYSLLDWPNTWSTAVSTMVWLDFQGSEVPAQPLTLDAERTTVHVHNVCDVCDGRVFTTLHEWQGRKTCVMCVMYLMKECSPCYVNGKVEKQARVWCLMKECLQHYTNGKIERCAEHVSCLWWQCSQSYTQLKKRCKVI